MKSIFWLGITLEAIGSLYCWCQIWINTQTEYDYASKVRPFLNVGLVLTALVLGALAAKYGFKSQKAANIIVLLPVIMLALSMAGMMIATIFVGGKWR